MPKTFITFGIATIAIAGIPPFSGFFSKDEILWAAWSGEHGHPLLWLTGFITAGLTAFYMTRVAVLTFFGENRITERPVDGHGREHDAYNVERHEIHESPASITIPLALLAFCATAAGFLGLPEALGGSNLFSRFLGPVMGSHGHSAPHDPMEYALMAASVAVAAGGMGAGYFLYGKRPDLPLLFARKLALPHKILTKKYYVDELYGVIFVSGTKLTSRFLSAFDRHVIDAVVNISALLLRAQSFMAAWFDNTFVDGIVNLVADSALYSGLKVRLMQTGKIQAYIMFLLAAVAAGIIYRVIS